MITARSVQHVMHIGGQAYPMTLRQNEDATWTAFADGKEATNKVRREAIAELVTLVRSSAGADGAISNRMGGF